MIRINQWLVTAAIAGMLCFGTSRVLAQVNPGAGNFGGGNFDPAQFQKMIMDNYRGQLEVTDEAEWKVIQDRIQKVLDARRDIGFAGTGMAARMFRRGGGSNAGPDVGQSGGERRGFSAFAPSLSPEEEALQKAIDSKATNSELKAALAKFLEARKQKQAKLEKAQAALREVLSVRQEAIASVSGLL